MIKVPKNFIVSNKLKDKIEIKIDYLANHQDLVSEVANLWIDGIGKVYHPKLTHNDMIKSFSERFNIDQLPNTFIALHFLSENEIKLAGICSIIPHISDGTEGSWFFENKMNEKEIAWLSGLVVDKSYRGYGIAELLINTIKESAYNFQKKNLLLGTFDSGLNEFYKKFDFEKIGDDFYHEIPYSVMCFSSLNSVNISSKLDV